MIHILKSFQKKVKSWANKQGALARMFHPFNIGKIAEQVKIIKSAVAPSLWACVVISLPLFYLANITTIEYLRIICIIVACIPVSTYFISYLYFTFTNPTYLRSEEYQVRMQALQLLGDKDNPFGTKAEDIVEITNPKLPSPKEQSENNDK